MGYNTAVIVLNDRLNEIVKDRDFGERLVKAIHACPASYGASVWGGPFTVLASRHADESQVVRVGGNGISLMGTGHYGQNDEELLRKLADDLGYALIKRIKVPIERKGK